MNVAGGTYGSCSVLFSFIMSKITLIHCLVEGRIKNTPRPRPEGEEDVFYWQKFREHNSNINSYAHPSCGSYSHRNVPLVSFSSLDIKTLYQKSPKRFNKLSCSVDFYSTEFLPWIMTFTELCRNSVNYIISLHCCLFQFKEEQKNTLQCWAASQP